MAKAIKEIIIMLLICLVTMLILAIVLYKYIPNRKVVPEVVTYAATEEVQDLLNDNIDTKSNSDNVILTYEVTSSDLKNYQSTNTYVPGKSNPFAAVDSSTTVAGTSTSSNSNGNSNSGSNENTGNSTKQPSDNSQNTNKNESTNPSVYQNTGTK